MGRPAIHRLVPTIDVEVDGIGYCKALFLIEYNEQMNSIWKCRRYDNGRIINAYDDSVVIHANIADGELPIQKTNNQ